MCASSSKRCEIGHVSTNPWYKLDKSRISNTVTNMAGTNSPEPHARYLSEVSKAEVEVGGNVRVELETLLAADADEVLQCYLS